MKSQKIKNAAIAVCMFLLPACFHGQSNKPSISVVGSPAYYNIKAPDGFSHQYSMKPSYRIGVEFYKPIWTKLGISATAGLMKLGYNAEYEFTIVDQGDPNIPRKADITARYLDIGYSFTYKSFDRPKFEIYYSTGSSYSRRLSSEVRTTFEDNSVRDSESLNDVLWCIHMGLGMHYKPNGRFAFKVEPQFKWFRGFDSLMSSPVRSFFVNTGIRYTFG